MVIVAHPDDADFGPAATAARWIDAGSVGWLVCCTSGDQGGEDPDLDPLALAATREAEQRAAAEIVGYAGVTLPPPAGRRAGQRPAAPRAARPRDPDVPAGRGADPGPRGHRLSGRAGSTTPTTGRPDWPPSTPSTRPPATRWPSRGWPAIGLAPAPGPPRSTCSGPTAPNAWVDVSATHRPEDRRAAGPRQPDQGPGRACPPDRGLGGRRRARRIGVAAAEDFRLAIIDDDEDEAPIPDVGAALGGCRAPCREAPVRAGGAAAGSAPRRSTGRSGPRPARRAGPPSRRG